MSSLASPFRSRAASAIDSDETHRQISGGRKQAPSFSMEADVSSRQPPPASRTASSLSREDCWSVEATRTLIDAWGSSLYRKLNRGNLRHPHWQEVANAVNATSPKYRRTKVQCKNRIDTVKKKYKIEKSKTVQSDGRYHSAWPHFESLDLLIGDSSPKPSKNHVNARGNIRRRYSTSPENSPSPKSSSDMGSPTEGNSPVTLKDPAARHQPTLTWTVPVGPRTKRARPNSVTERNFSVMAAAAAAAMETEDDEEEDSGSRRRPPPMTTTRAAGINRKSNLPKDRTVMEEGYKKLADSITMLAQIYQKVEETKQRHIVELEKQRMQFARDLEIQRMKIYMETQLQIEKRRRSRLNTENCKS